MKTRLQLGRVFAILVLVKIDWQRVASGHYEAFHGRYLLWRIPDVTPPAWNVEDTHHFNLIVDGAATMRDARALADKAILEGAR